MKRSLTQKLQGA